MNVIEEVIHIILDVISGARNLPAHEAAVLHDKVTPGYNDVPVTSEQLAAAQAVVARAQAEAAENAGLG